MEGECVFLNHLGDAGGKGRGGRALGSPLYFWITSLAIRGRISYSNPTDHTGVERKIRLKKNLSQVATKASLVREICCTGGLVELETCTAAPRHLLPEETCDVAEGGCGSPWKAASCPGLSLPQRDREPCWSSRGAVQPGRPPLSENCKDTEGPQRKTS